MTKLSHAARSRSTSQWRRKTTRKISLPSTRQHLFCVGVCDHTQSPAVDMISNDCALFRVGCVSAPEDDRGDVSSSLQSSNSSSSRLEALCRPDVQGDRRPRRKTAGRINRSLWAPTALFELHTNAPVRILSTVPGWLAAHPHLRGVQRPRRGDGVPVSVHPALS